MTLIGDVLIVAGALLVLLATVGLYRFDDLFSRIHSASKATSGGFLLLATGAAIHLESTAARVELLLATVLLLITTPVGVHLLARAAVRTNNPRPENLAIDELPAPDISSESAARSRASSHHPSRPPRPDPREDL